MIETIRTLTETYGPSGHEDQIRDVVLKMIDDLTDEKPTVDALGNIIAWQRSAKAGVPVIMLAAHIDEIGLMVTHVDKEGFMRFTNIGGMLPNTLHGNRVLFADGTIGAIGIDSNYRRGHPGLDQLFIDLSGQKHKIGVGDAAGLHRELVVNGERLIGKSLDDRIGVAVQIEVMRQLKDKKLPVDVAYTFSVQEEVGVRGATTAAYGIQPHYGIAIDVTGTGDTANGAKMEVGLGKGPAIKIKDTGMLSAPEVIAMLEKAAKKARVKTQREVLTGGSTDARAIQLTGAGVKAGALSIPCRYVHTTSEMVDMNDVEGAVKMLVALLQTKAPV